MEGLVKLFQIVLLDIVLSGDNAVIVGAKAATLPPEQRKKAIFYGMSMAVVFRIVFSLFATFLVTIPGLRFAGGLALLWVAYGMLTDLWDDGSEDGSTVAPAGNFRSALMAIAIADISMSIDNVLAVAGAAEGHFASLAFGLVLSIAIMIFAANAVARLIQRWAWIAWIGLLLVCYIAGKLIVEDWPNVLALVS
jgi:YjbE family integral membrane protein